MDQDADGPTDVRSFVSTGHLPDPDDVQEHLEVAFARCADVRDGAVADYIPALAQASPDLFGACIVDVDGRVHAVGSAREPFSIQSVSKPFVFALVCEAVGAEEARTRLGVNATGLPFNSVMAVELNDNRTMNPMVNAGAIATTSLVPGDSAEEKWANVLDGLSRFAGHRLELDDDVYTQSGTRTSATVVSPTCSTATDASTSIPTRRPRCTPGSAHCASPPRTWP